MKSKKQRRSDAEDENETREKQEKHRKKRKLHVSPLAPIPLLCFLLVGNTETLLCTLLAAILHECGHLFVLYLLGGRVERAEILPFGGEIVAGGRTFSYGESALLSFSGAAVNLVCALPLLFSDGRMPNVFLTFSGCSLGLALFNLLPVRGLDGGEILSDILLFFFSPGTVCRVMNVTTVCFAFSLILFFARALLENCFDPFFILLALFLLFAVGDAAKRAQD